MNYPDPLYDRYSRQTILPGFGETGQQKLAQSKILMVGAGGLGCAALPYLAGAGVGTIGIVDNDVVALHNLHRQVLYTADDIGLSKAKQAAIALKKLNPGVVIQTFQERLTAANALQRLQDYDIIIDGTDNFSSRYMLNDACVLLNKPLVYGAVSRFEGQVTVFNGITKDSETPVNYRDLFPQPPEAGDIQNCAEAGVLGVLPGIIGVMQATEAIKWIAGIGDCLVNRLLTYNALNNQVFELRLSAQAGTRSLIPANAAAFEQTNYDWLCGVTGNDINEIDAAAFDHMKEQDNVLVVDVREPGEQPTIDTFYAVNIPLRTLRAAFPETACDTIVVVCQSGKRSRQAAVLLNRIMGNKNIYSLAGGIQGWKKEHAF